MITLTEAQATALETITGSGTANFWVGYKYLQSIVVQYDETEQVEYWLTKAAEINANSITSEANTYIRSVTRSGLLYDEDTDVSLSRIQHNSDLIGIYVISNALNDGEIQDINTIIVHDASSAVIDGGQTLAGWGGAFNYWGISYNVNGSVGDNITNSIAEYDKFITVAAKGVAETIAKHGYSFEQAFTALGSSVDLWTKAIIFDRWNSGNYIGSPDVLESPGNMIYYARLSEQNEVEGWYYAVGPDGENEVEISDPSQLSVLNARREKRLELLSDEAFNIGNPDPGRDSADGIAAAENDFGQLNGIIKNLSESVAAQDGVHIALSELVGIHAGQLAANVINGHTETGIISDSILLHALRIEFSEQMDQNLGTDYGAAHAAAFNALDDAAGVAADVKAVTKAWWGGDGAGKVSGYLFETNNGEAVDLLGSLGFDDEKTNTALVGGDSDDTIVGQAGNDILIGNGGNDVLDGGDGNNILFGGAGQENTYKLHHGENLVLGSSGEKLILDFSGASEPDPEVTADPEAPLTASAVLGTAGNEVFVFQSAYKAPLTVVYGGGGSDTFDLQDPNNMGINVYALQIDGVDANNFMALDLEKVEEYIGQIDDGDGYGGGAGHIVIINPDADDVLKYNSNQISTPQSYMLSYHEQETRASEFSTGFDPFTVVGSNPLEFIEYAYTRSDANAYYTDLYRRIYDKSETYGAKYGSLDFSLIEGSIQTGESYTSVRTLSLELLAQNPDTDLTPYEQEYIAQAFYLGGDTQPYPNGGRAYSGYTYEKTIDHYYYYKLGGADESYFEDGRHGGVSLIGFNDGDFGISTDMQDPYAGWAKAEESLWQVGEWETGEVITDFTDIEDYVWDSSLPVVIGIDPETFLDVLVDAAGEGWWEDWDGNVEKIFSDQIRGDDFDRPSLDIADFLRDPSVNETGDEGDDILKGGGADDILNGADGGDFLEGGAGDDRLVGGIGNDTLVGGDGNDTYIYSRGDGNDIVTDESGRADRLLLTDIASTEIAVSSNGSDMIILIPENSTGAGNGGSIALKDGTTGSVEQVVFSDVTWTRAQLIAAVPTDYVGTSGDDTLTGSGGNDTLTGGAGNDMLVGGSGDDIYVYNLGDGFDAIMEEAGEGNNDTLVLNDLLPGDLTFARRWDDLDIVVSNNTDPADAGTVTVVNAFSQEPGTGIEQVVFGDSTTWNRDDLLAVVGIVYKGYEQDINTVASGLVLDRTFNLASNSDITDSTLIPHTTIFATSSGGQEYYKFTVGAGERGIFDIDGASFDTVVDLFDINDNWIAGNDDSDADAGSTAYNSYLDHTFDTAGTYYLRLSTWDAAGVGSIPDGADYTLHVSLEGRAPAAASTDDLRYTAEDLTVSPPPNLMQGGVSRAAVAAQLSENSRAAAPQIADNDLGVESHFAIHDAFAGTHIPSSSFDYTRFNSAIDLPLSDMAANSNYDASDFWFEPEPIGGLV